MHAFHDLHARACSSIPHWFHVIQAMQTAIALVFRIVVQLPVASSQCIYIALCLPHMPNPWPLPIFSSRLQINLYFSWTHNCLQGFKVTYGYDARNAQLLGVEKGLTEKSITLAPYENINKVEIKQGNANK